ncbi:MAG: diacylglycerol kinase family protein [Nonlabens sp.]|uniref:diacylglycerol/lipid kinase family protein n=1 Tax=Nonlabens sp. TaxID=1888209 RepID=UPI00321C16FA
MIKLAFLVNPISGKSGNRLEYKELTSHLSEKSYQIDILYSSSKRNLEKLTLSCVKNKVDIIIAVGGDGTVNTIAKHLVKTNIKLGILPRGSGNGLAGHLGILNSVPEMCRSLKTLNTIRIDCGIVNDQFFFSNFALGYPAEVIHRYDKDFKRGFITYFKHGIKAYFANRKNKIKIEGHSNPKYSVLVSNTKYLGYKVSLTPGAKINNGYLSLIYAKSRKDLTLKIGQILLFKKNYAQSVKEINLHCSVECPAQLDGEPVHLQPPYSIKVKQNCLDILIQTKTKSPH